MKKIKQLWNWFRLWYYRIYYHRCVFYVNTRISYNHFDVINTIERPKNIMCIYSSIPDSVDFRLDKINYYKTGFICLN